MSDIDKAAEVRTAVLTAWNAEVDVPDVSILENSLRYQLAFDPDVIEAFNKAVADEGTAQDVVGVLKGFRNES